MHGKQVIYGMLHAEPNPAYSRAARKDLSWLRKSPLGTGHSHLWEKETEHTYE